MQLKGKVAVVTGAAHGIGRACVRKLHEHGATVALLDLDGDALAEAKREIGGHADRVLTLTLDLTNEADVIAAFQDIKLRLGPVDILVNNVGQGAREKASTFQASRKESWDFLLGVCLDTTILCTHQVIGDMQARKAGKIVNISSDSAFIGAKASAAYAAAKAGVIGFTRSLSREVAADLVTVNSVAPGYIRTRAMDLLPKEMSAKALTETPMGIFGEPDDIANAVLFFSSDMSRYVTGQTLIVNGGRWMN